MKQNYFVTGMFLKMQEKNKSKINKILVTKIKNLLQKFETKK